MKSTYDTYANFSGWVEKKANSAFVGWQSRFLRVVNGKILLYCEKDKDPEPKVIDLSDIIEVKKIDSNKFDLTIKSRKINYRTKNSHQTDEWVKVFNFFISSIPKKQFKEEHDDKAVTTALADIDKGKMELVRSVGFGITEDWKLNEKLLVAKGIDKLLNLNNPEIKSRMYSGFLYKKHKSREIFQKRWFFLFSSRPLKNEQYEKDELTLFEKKDTPERKNTQRKYTKEWIKFDQMFYFKYENEYESSGPINGLDVHLSHEISPIDKDGKYFLLFDCDDRKFEYYADLRGERDLWFEALKNARRTANEIISSGTKHPRNIQRLDNILQSGQEKLKDEMEKEQLKLVGNYKEITDFETLTFILKTYRKTIASTIDGCVSNSPPKKDLLTIYAEYNLNSYLTIIQSFWSSQYDSLDGENILLLAASLFNFEDKLKRLRVTEPNLGKNAKELVKIYMKKTYKNITDVIENILKSEREVKAIKSENGELMTNGPNDLFDILSKSYGLIKESKIKYTHEKMLNMFYECIIQYLIGIDCVISNFNLIVDKDFLIAIANNSVLVNTLLNSLIDSCKETTVLNDREVNIEIRSKEILSSLNLMSNNSVTRFVTDLSQKLAESFDCNFLQLDLHKVLIVISDIYGDLNSLMNGMIRRKCWEEVLKLTVFYYIKLLLTTAHKKVKQMDELSTKLEYDKGLLNETFSNYVGENLTKANLKIIDDILDFLQISSYLIPSTCHTLREYVGPSFNLNMVRALVKLRCDFTKDEKKEAISMCKEVLDNYVDKNKGKKHGFFDRMQQELKLEMDDEDNDELIPDDEIDEEEKQKQEQTKCVELEDFLNKEENEEDEDKKDEKEEEDKKEEEETKEEKEEQISDVVCEGMMEKKTYNTWQSRFFQLKNGYLYWFKDRTSSIVQNKLSIEKTLKVESHKDRKFLIMVKDQDTGGKLYKFSCETDEDMHKWINAITSEMKRLKGEEVKKESSIITIKQRKKIIEDYYKLPNVGKERTAIKLRIINSIQNETFFKFKQAAKKKKDKHKKQGSGEKGFDDTQELNEGTMQQFEIGFDEAKDKNNGGGIFSCCGNCWVKLREMIFGSPNSAQKEHMRPLNEV